MKSKIKMAEEVFFKNSMNIFNDKATRNKINRHLSDINDTITEEDIKNIIVTIPIAEKEILVGYRNKQ